MKKVVITGLSGFVGKNLGQYLNGKFKIIGVGRNSEFSYDDFLNLNFDAIVHLAGKAHDLKNVENPDEYYKINFELTKTIYDAFLFSTAKTFIFISSVKAVADEVNEILLEESLAYPKTHYGKSKLQAERYILSKLHPDKQVVILRPCMIYGSGNKGNLNLLFNMVRKGIPYPLGAFQNKRSFLSVENFCFIIKEILENHEIPSGIFNISDDEPISTVNLVVMMANVLGKKPQILKIPKILIFIVSKIGDILNLPLNTERLKKLTENYVVSNKKLKLFIKKDLPIISKEGLLQTILTFK